MFLVRQTFLLALGAAALLGLAMALGDLFRGRVRVRGASMAPTLLPGDDLLASRLLISARGVRRGDIVVLGLGQPDHPDRLDLKRIVGLPGERITMYGGRAAVDGVPLLEPYVELTEREEDAQEWTVGDEEFFVLGDNRRDSTDSRRYGPVHASAVVGKVWWRTGPSNRWGRL